MLQALCATNELREKNTMNYSVTNVVCDKCANIFPGTLIGLMYVGKIYIATCPECENKVTFNPCATFIETAIPKGAVIIKPVDEV